MALVFLLWFIFGACSWSWTMADNRPAKLRKLDSLRRRLPHMSQNEMAALPRDVEEHGLPELTTRQSMTEARTLVANTRTLHGPIITQINVDGVDGSTTSILCFNLLSYMVACFDQCESWRKLIVDRHQSSPSSVESPWSLIVYTDEITPGNLLSHSDR